MFLPNRNPMLVSEIRFKPNVDQQYCIQTPHVNNSGICRTVLKLSKTIFITHTPELSYQEKGFI